MFGIRARHRILRLDTKNTIHERKGKVDTQLHPNKNPLLCKDLGSARKDKLETGRKSLQTVGLTKDWLASRIHAGRSKFNRKEGNWSFSRILVLNPLRCIGSRGRRGPPPVQSASWWRRELVTTPDTCHTAVAADAVSFAPESAVWASQTLRKQKHGRGVLRTPLLRLRFCVISQAVR